MIKFLLLLAGLAITAVIVVAAVIAVIIGLLKKKRELWRQGALIAAVAALIFAIGSAYGAWKTINKVRNADYRGMWVALIEEVRDDTAIPPDNPVTAKQTLGLLLGDTTVLQGTTVQGVSVGGVLLSYHYFTYRTTDEDKLLRVIAAAPADSTWSISSDTSCSEISWEAASEYLMDTYTPQRNLPGWSPETAADRRCYYCLRVPWQQVVMIDRATGTVYHYFGEIRE